MSEPNYVIPIALALGDAWPSDLVRIVGDATGDRDVLARVGLSDVEVGRNVDFRAAVVLRDELALDLPGISGLALVLGRREDGATRIPVELSLADPFTLRLAQFPVLLRFPRDMLQPVVREDGRYRVATEDGARVEIGIEPGVIVTGDGELTITQLEDFVVTSAFMIGDSGLVVEIPRFRLVLSETPVESLDGARDPEDVPPDFRGLWVPEATLFYQKDGATLPPLSVQRAAIGSGGFSGTVALGLPANAERELGESVLERWRTSDAGEAQAQAEGAWLGRIEDMVVVLFYFGATFRQSVPTASSIVGYLYLAFAEKWVRFRASIGGPDADFMLDIGGAGEPLISLDHEWFTIQADSIAYLTKDGKHYAQISGRIKPKIGGLDWPTLKVDKLRIGSDGEVELEGGWLEFPDSLTLDFHAFKISLTQLGMGSETDNEGTDDEVERQWLGLSGSINLIEGLPLSASVEGLKFSWPKEGGGPVRTSLTGIGVSLEIPNTIRLSGSVSYKEMKPEDNPGGLSGHLFTGHVDLNLIALRTQIAGQLIIGRLTDAAGNEFTTFYIVLRAELPSPIPLGGTGTGIYGLAGLFGMHIAPERRLVEGEPEPWYTWYLGGGGRPERDVTAIQKWAPEYDNYAFGAGLTLGTQPDDGFTINLKALVAVLIPGPVIMIEGRANLLQQRSGDNNQEGALYALVVFDGRAGTFQMNIDVRYSIESVISVGGGMEAFFDFNDATAWYVHIGKKDPESKRIQAEILSIVQARAYFMIDNKGLMTGAFVGVDWREEYGPVSIAIVARFSFDATIFWKPLHLEGAIELYGEIALKILGIGFELILQLLLAARAPSPYWIHGKARFKLSLPWPLPTLDLEAEFTWEEPRAALPESPFLKDVALVHHKMPGASWPALERHLDSSAAEIAGILASEQPPADAPVLPVDVRPVLSFARPVHHLPRQPATTDPQRFADVPEDEVGDFSFAYQLEDVRLEIYDPDERAWELVRSGVNGPDSGTSFQVDDRSFVPGWDAQEPRVQLWRNHALDTTALSEREQVGERYPPCPEPFTAPATCVEWDTVPEGFVYPHVFRHRGLRLRGAVRSGEIRSLTVRAHSSVPKRYLLAPVSLSVNLPETAGWLELTVAGVAPSVLAFHRGRNVPVGPAVSRSSTHVFTIEEPVDILLLLAHPAPARPPSWDDIELLRMLGAVALVSICYKTQADVVREEEARAGGETVSDRASTGDRLILAPDRAYRLSVTTATSTMRLGQEPSRDTDRASHYYYFRTDDGPGTAPADTGVAPHSETPINLLATYLSGTTPHHGAVNFYYSYDLRLAFNEPYVRQMYRGPLEIRVRDRNGRVVGTPEGTFVTSRLGMMPVGWLTLLNAMRASRCGTSSTSEDAPVLLRSAPVLAPRRMYTAEVITEGLDADEPLYVFQFATSRYADVVAHLTSGHRDGEQVVRPHPAVSDFDRSGLEAHVHLVEALEASRRALATALVGADPLDIAEEVEEARIAFSTLHEASSTQFESLADDLSAGTGPLPPAVEITQLVVLETNEILLLLESPEPIDWARTVLTCQSGEAVVPAPPAQPPLPVPPVRGPAAPVPGTIRPGLPTVPIGGRRGTVVPLHVVWNDDQTRAFLIPRHSSRLTAGAWDLTFRYTGDGNLELPEITRGQTPVNETVRAPIRLV